MKKQLIQQSGKHPLASIITPVSLSSQEATMHMQVVKKRVFPDRAVCLHTSSLETRVLRRELFHTEDPRYFLWGCPLLSLLSLNTYMQLGALKKLK